MNRSIWATLVFFACYGTAHGQVMRFDMIGDCAESAVHTDYIRHELEQFPFAAGAGIVQTRTGDFVDTVWKIYASRDLTEFTTVLEFPWDNITCLIGMGYDLGPFEEP